MSRAVEALDCARGRTKAEAVSAAAMLSATKNSFMVVQGVLLLMLPTGTVASKECH